MNKRPSWGAWVAALGIALLAAGSALAVDNIATNSGNWENGGTWSQGHAPLPAEDVVIPTNITVTINGLATNSINSLSIAGTLTHAANTTNEAHKLILDVAGDVTVASNGLIDVSSKGYSSGPGYLSGTVGHGGEGGTYNNQRGPTYGSVTNPTSLGSDSSSVKGGGAAILRVVGVLTIQAGGVIRANGDSNTAFGQFGGSGGSINITAAELAGAGTISANGGNSRNSNGNRGGAGGGRIAVVVTNAAGFDSVTFSAFGGDGGTEIGGAGTVYLRTQGQTYGDLLVANSNQTTAACTMTADPINRFDSIITTNSGCLAVASNSVLDLRGCALYGDSVVTNITSRIVFGPHTNSVIWPAPFTNTITFSQRGTNTVIVPTDVTVASVGIFTHEANGNWPSPGEEHKLNLAIAGDLTVASNGAICVSSKGYYNSGPGYLSGTVGHGGEGGLYDSQRGPTYGSVTGPTSLGSGGLGVRGGGAAILRVDGVLTIQAGVVIRANGDSNTGFNSFGGSAGSINITAAELAGAGTISANGGNSRASGGSRGGPGGGRIAIALTGSDSFGSVTFGAFGGDGGTEIGAAGTIYLQTPSQAGGKGTVTINNNALTTAARTQIPPATNAVLDELRYASVIVTNYGAMEVTTNDRIQSLTVATANEPLDLGAAGTVLTLSEMTVNGTTYTKGGLYTTNNWNGFATPANASGDGAILLYQVGGSVFLFR